MPQLEVHLFPTQLFWLIVTFIPLYLFMWRVALPRVTSVRESRRERIDADLEKATQLKEEAEAALADYEKTMAEAAAKAQDALRDAARQVAEEAASRREALAASLAEQTAEAERRIAAEKAAAIEGLGDVAVELVQAAAGRLSDVTVSDDEARAAIDNVLRGGR